MTGKFLGKIVFAEYGTVRDYPYLMGLQLEFSMQCGNCGCGKRYTVNISEDCNWEESDRKVSITASVDKVHDILTDAKVNYVSELKGKPVEVVLENSTFKDFRILKEVL